MIVAYLVTGAASTTAQLRQKSMTGGRRPVGT